MFKLEVNANPKKAESLVCERKIAKSASNQGSSEEGRFAHSLQRSCRRKPWSRPWIHQPVEKERKCQTEKKRKRYNEIETYLVTDGGESSRSPVTERGVGVTLGDLPK